MNTKINNNSGVGNASKRTTRDGELSTPATSTTTTAQKKGERAHDEAGKRTEAARRTLERLGQKVALKPSPEVPVEDRAGKTAARTGKVRDGGKKAVTTFAAIDLGSSSAKMLVQKRGPDGRFRTVLDKKIGAALGKGVENGKPIPAENQQRALDALTQFIADAEKLGVKAGDIPMITTAVVRNSSNGDELVEKIKDLGLGRVKVLQGAEEAATGFAGALAMLNGAPGRYATLDLGGGSFQLAVGAIAGDPPVTTMEQGASTQVGSNIILDTMVTPLLSADGKGRASDFAAIDDKIAALAPMPLDTALLAGRTLVATGGVSKFLRAHFGKDVVTRADIDGLRKQVIELSYADRIAVVTQGKDETTKTALGVGTPEGASDYGKKLPASSSLLLRILDGLGVDEVRVSETDARHALIAARAHE